MVTSAAGDHHRHGYTALWWWYPLSWSVYPVFYSGFVLIQAAVIERPPGANRYVYPFLNLEMVSGGQFALTVINFIIGFVALGYLIMGIAKAQRGVWERTHSPG